jgi:hypothetical protein
MIKTETVFVLGAGAGWPYGLPLGNELYNKVIENFGAANKTHVDEMLALTPFSRDAVERFVSALHYSGLTSVDAFLERRSEFLDIGKAAMAIELLKLESHAKLWDSPRNWMKHLYSRLVTDGVEQFVENKVTFITYNYDRSLEHFLCTSLCNTYDVHEHVAGRILAKKPVIHLHGRLGYLPWEAAILTVPFQVPTLDAQLIEICQREIKVVHEDVADRDDDFNKARDALQNAERIYFLGFGFGAQNIERLRFEHFKDDRTSGTGLHLTDLERATIRTECKNKIHLYDLDCVDFLRRNAQLT